MPADVLARARLGGEKVLAASPTADDTWLLGTRDALVIVGPDQTAHLPWETVESADWDRAAERFRVVEVGAYGQPQPRHDFDVTDPGLLLELVRERVTASVVLQRRVELRGRTGFFVIARRPPNGRGEISWAWQFDPGVDPEDPAVRAAADLGLRTAAEELGLQ